jgi:hypothetical protein
MHASELNERKERLENRLAALGIKGVNITFLPYLDYSTVEFWPCRGLPQNRQRGAEYMVGSFITASFIHGAKLAGFYDFFLENLGEREKKYARIKARVDKRFETVFSSR